MTPYPQKLQNVERGDRGLPPIESQMLMQMLAIYAPGGVLERRIQELNHSVVAEGYAYLSKPIPQGYGLPKEFDQNSLEKLPLRLHVWGNDEILPSKSELPKDSDDLARLDALLANLRKNDVQIDYSKSDTEPFTLTSEIRKIYRSKIMKWDEQDGNPEVLFRLGWTLSSFAYRMLRQAKLAYHIERSPNPKTESETKWIKPSMSNEPGKSPGQLWRLVNALCYYALHSCRILPPEFEKRERELRIRILTTYGLALGCLGRPSEANRRLNEAHALTLHRPTEDLPLQLARIHLRRAEVSIYTFLEEFPGESVANENETERKDVDKACFAWAHLGDAWTATERAEKAMNRKNHSSFWWYRLSITKLSCLAVLGKALSYAKTHPSLELKIDIRASLPMRRRQHPETEIKRLLMEALFSSAGDEFRELRAADYALDASRLCSIDGSLEESPVSIGVSKIQNKEDNDPLYSHLFRVLTSSLKDRENLEKYQESLKLRYKLSVIS